MLSPHYGDFASPSLTFTTSTPSPIPTPTALHMPISDSTTILVPIEQLSTEPDQKVRLLDILTRRNGNSSTQIIRLEPLSKLSSTSLPSTHVTSASTAQACAPPLPHLPTTRQTSDLNTRRPSLSNLLASLFERRKSQAGFEPSQEHVDQPVGASMPASRRLKGVPTLEEIGGRIRIRKEKLGEDAGHIEDSIVSTKKEAKQSGTGTEDEKKILPLPLSTQLSIQKTFDRSKPPSIPKKSTITPVESTLHPLSHTYSFYFRPLATLTKATPRKSTGNKNNDLNKVLEEYTEVKAGVKDLETFCPNFNRAKRPSQLAMSGLTMGVGQGGESVAIVRESEISEVQVKPTNIGYWNLSFPSSSTSSISAITSSSADKRKVSTAFALDRYWTWLVLGMVGGELDSNHRGRSKGCQVLGAFATVSKDGTRSMRLWINLPPSDASPSSGLIKNSPLSVSCTPGIISSEGMMKNGESTSTAKCPDTSKNAYTPQQIEKINKLGHKLLFLLELEEKETKADPLQLDDPKEKKEKEKENFRFGFHHPASTAGLGSAKLPSLFFCIDNNVSAAPDSIASRLPSSSGSGRW